MLRMPVDALWGVLELQVDSDSERLAVVSRGRACILLRVRTKGPPRRVQVRVPVAGPARFTPRTADVEYLIRYSTSGNSGFVNFEF